MSDIHESVGSYVVNALDDEELADFEAHLATCESCRREVMEFSETAAQLSTLTESAPPQALRGSILSAIQQVRPLPPEELPSAPTALPRRAVAATVRHDDETRADDETPVVDELALRRQRRSTRVLALAVAAAMVVALALGGWVVNLVQDRQAQVAESTLEHQVLSAPDAQLITKTMTNGAPVTFLASKSLDKAMFYGNQLPDPGAGKRYQLWTLEGTSAIPDQTVTGGANRRTWLTGDISSADAVAVTIEPAGGSTVPTKPLLVSAELQ